MPQQYNTTNQELLEVQHLGIRHNAIVIPYPVDLLKVSAVRGLFRAEHPELAERIILLFLSRVDPKKGLDLLLHAFARIRATHPNAILVVAGDGNPTFIRGLKHEAARLCLGSGIMWTGFLSGERKNAALADADIFILASHSENFCLAAVEAMSAGLPVIVSNQVGIHEKVTAAQAGFVVGCTSEEIEAALLKILLSAELRGRMGANAAALAEQFSANISTSMLLDEYSRIASPKLNTQLEGVRPRDPSQRA